MAAVQLSCPGQQQMSLTLCPGQFSHIAGHDPKSRGFTYGKHLINWRELHYLNYDISCVIIWEVCLLLVRFADGLSLRWRYPSLRRRFVPAGTDVLWKIKSVLCGLKNHAWSVKIILFIIYYSWYNIQGPHKLIAASFHTEPETSTAGCHTFSCAFYFNLFFFILSPIGRR